MHKICKNAIYLFLTLILLLLSAKQIEKDFQRLYNKMIQQKEGCRPSRPHPSKLFLYQRRQFHEHIRHPALELFIVPLEPGDLLRVHAEGVGMDGHLIEIVGAPPL